MKILSCVILLLLAGCAGTPISTSYVTLTEGQIASVKTGVSQSLKDPNSAQFGRMNAAQDTTGTTYVCGMVNAKNSFGGYVGSVPYMGMFAGQVFLVTFISTQEDISLMMIKGDCHKYGIEIY